MEFFINFSMMFWFWFVIVAIVEAAASPLKFRVFRGNDTTIEEHPYQVSLEILRTNGKYLCGGSIISPNYIVTAAHCSYDVLALQINVRVGSSNLYKGGRVVGLKSIYNHPYSSGNAAYDISVLQLAESLQFSSEVLPIGLPDDFDYLAPGTVMTVTGWGLLFPMKKQYPWNTPDVLQTANLTIISQEECQSFFRHRISDDMLCAGGPQEGKRACRGDSGGPLVHNGKLYGVVSWTLIERGKDFPSVFADVVALRSFIREVTGGL